jgi:hypothetical protein
MCNYNPTEATNRNENIMKIVQQLTKELNEMNAKRLAVIAANSVEGIAPKSSRGFTYRKSPAIKSQDLSL